MVKSVIIIFLLAFYTLFSIPLNLKVDGAVFRYDSLSNIIELYYSFSENSLRYIYEDGKYTAELDLKVNIFSVDKLLDSTIWNLPLQTNKTIIENPSDMIGIKSFRLKTGSYNMEVLATDKNDPSNKFKKKFQINSRNYYNKKLILSDIQIAQKIENEANPSQIWDNSFHKNSFFVIPNPGAEIYSAKPTLNSYCEIYNAKSTCPEGLKITYFLFDATWNEVFRHYKDMNSISDGLVESISMPIEALSSGVYFLKIQAKSKYDDKFDTASVIKKIYVLNLEMPARPLNQYYESLAFEKSEFSSLSEEQVITVFEQSKIKGNEYENDLFDKCTTLDAKKRFLYAFWKRRNADTLLPYNKAFAEFNKLIDYTNLNFQSGLMKEGWKSDRGRIILKYGMPTTTNTTPQNGDQRSYQKWYYDEIQGGVEFDFVDFFGNGNCTLVNSTARGEIKNVNWRERYIDKIDPNPNGGYPTRDR